MAFEQGQKSMNVLRKLTYRTYKNYHKTSIAYEPGLLSVKCRVSKSVQHRDRNKFKQEGHVQHNAGLVTTRMSRVFILIYL